MTVTKQLQASHDPKFTVSIIIAHAAYTNVCTLLLNQLQAANSTMRSKYFWFVSNAMLTCEIKLFRQRLSVIILPEIVSKLFQRLIAAHEYFPTCSMSLK